MSLGMTYSPTVPDRGGLQVTNFRPVFTYNNGYWEMYSRFQGIFLVLGVGLRGGGYVGGSFLGENMSWGNRNSMKRAQDFLILL